MGYGDNDNPRKNTFFIDISADDDLSEPMFKGHLDICGLIIPSGFDGTSVGFTASQTKTGTYGPVTWEGTALAFTVAAGDWLMIDPAKLSNVGPWVKLTSNANEDGDVEITPIFRGFA